MNETATPAIAVVRTQLPYVDRRSLSEAWFSALHLVAADAGRIPPGARRCVAPAGAKRIFSPPEPHARTLAGDPAASGPRRGAPAARGHAGALERVRFEAMRATAARANGTAAARSYPARRTSLTVGVGHSRVQLVLRREGNVLHVVAVCRADVAPLVRRALACADAFVRRSGDSVRASVRVASDVRGPA